MNILNILRLSGNTGSAQSNDFFAYNNINNYSVFGYIIIFIAIFCIFEKPFNNKKWLIYSLLCSILLIISIIQIIKNFPEIVDYNIIFSSLRNPIKLMYPGRH